MSNPSKETEECNSSFGGKHHQMQKTHHAAKVFSKGSERIDRLCTALNAAGDLQYIARAI